MLRKHWLNLLIIILLISGIISGLYTKNQIKKKSERADKLFIEICYLYELRDSLAKQLFSENNQIVKLNFPKIPSMSDYSIGKASKSGINFVKSNIQLQEKLDSSIRIASKKYSTIETYKAKLTENENDIRELKNKYHKHAKDYNTFIKQFPRNYYANVLNFEPKIYYDKD